MKCHNMATALHVDHPKMIFNHCHGAISHHRDHVVSVYIPVLQMHSSYSGNLYKRKGFILCILSLHSLRFPCKEIINLMPFGKLTDSKISRHRAFVGPTNSALLES